MVQITERATEELRRLLTDHMARPQQGVRLRLSDAGKLAMTIDIPHSGDSIIRRDNLPVLIVDGRLSVRLAQRVLDFRAPAGAGGGFTLHWRPSINDNTYETRTQPGRTDVEEGWQQSEAGSQATDGE